MLRLPFERPLVRLALACGVALFIVGPSLIGLGERGLHWWFDAGRTIAPLVSALACFRAASLSLGADRRAWRHFGLGSAFWLAGTLCRDYFGLRGAEPPFPSLADAGYLLACFFCITGMHQFGAISRIGRAQVCNFALVTAAAALISCQLLFPSIAAARLDLPGTLAALTHPVFWTGAAAFGAICLLFYVPPGKRLVAAIILGSIVAQAAAALFHGLALLGTAYTVGSFFDGFWVIGFAAIAWAAAEQSWQVRDGQPKARAAAQREWQQRGEAFVPVAAIALVLATDLAANAHAYGALYLTILPVTLGFIVALAVREHWSLKDERELRIAAEENAFRFAESRERLASVLESTSDSVMVLDRDWRITYLNRRAMSLGDEERALAVGRNLWDLFPDAVDGSFDLNFREAMERQVEVEFEACLPSLGRWFKVHAYPSPDALSVFFRDVSERRRTREELAYLAHHDHLTGLYNRRRFGELLDGALARASAESPTALLYLDLDEFKDVNDTLGHPVGDAVLRTMADRLRACAGEGNVLARVGGDEFSVIAERLGSSEDAADLARRIIASLRDPYVIEGQTLIVGTSIGIVVSPADGLDPDQLLRKADIALYSAKADGKGTYHFFDPAMAERIASRQILKSDLGRALKGGELNLAFQPIVDLRDGRVSSFEALLRWTHPERGPISPANFIPIAEETGLIAEIGDWVLNEACREACKWPREVGLAVNLSSVQFRNSSLPLRVAGALSASGLSPERLELEITETVLLRDSDANFAMLHQLRELGVRIALDDFGTGYSSLSYLHRFPFSKLKIDRSFIAELVERNESKAIVRAAVSLGQALQVTITAEGVENRAQLESIREAGCDQAQGYFFSRPTAATEVPKLIETVNSRTVMGQPRLRTG